MTNNGQFAGTEIAWKSSMLKRGLCNVTEARKLEIERDKSGHYRIQTLL